MSQLTFVDTNIFVYAVGRAHPLREAAQMMPRVRLHQHVPMATSAEVLQELLHVYLPVGRTATLEAALRLASDLAVIWSIDAEDVHAAHAIASTEPGLGARDLLHRAVAQRHSARERLSFDRALVAAFSKG